MMLHHHIGELKKDRIYAGQPRFGLTLGLLRKERLEFQP